MRWLSIDPGAAAEKATSGFDPVRWAEAAALLAKNPALYMFVGLIVVFIVCKWPPWRMRGKAEE